MDTAGSTLMKFGVIPRYNPLTPSVRMMCWKTPPIVNSLFLAMVILDFTTVNWIKAKMKLETNNLVYISNIV